MTQRSSRDRVERFRDAMRRRGMRPVQIWVADTRLPEFAEEARRQCLAIDAADEQSGTMDWIERIGLFDETNAPG